MCGLGERLDWTIDWQPLPNFIASIQGEAGESPSVVPINSPRITQPPPLENTHSPNLSPWARTTLHSWSVASCTCTPPQLHHTYTPGVEPCVPVLHHTPTTSLSLTHYHTTTAPPVLPVYHSLSPLYRMKHMYPAVMSVSGIQYRTGLDTVQCRQ